MNRILIYGLSNNWGGVEAIVMAIVERLSQYCQFDIIHSEFPSAYETRYGKNANIRFVHIPTWGSDRKGFVRGLKNLLQSIDYDYVWINACIMSNVTFATVVKRNSNAKIITHSHGSSFEEKNIIIRWVLLAMHYWNRKKYLKMVDIPCCCSFKSAQWFYGKNYVKKHDVYFIKNGVDFQSYRYNSDVRKKYRKELEVDDDTLVLFHAGRLTQVKNQRKLFEILQALLSKGNKALLMIAGVGELHDELLEYASELGINHFVRFLGMRDDVNSIMQAADVFLLPSFHEGFPVTIVEAQSAGLPCLVSASLSREIDITQSVIFIPVEARAEEWSNAIETFDSEKRYEISSLVKQRGYDIVDVANEFKKKFLL